MLYVNAQAILDRGFGEPFNVNSAPETGITRKLYGEDIRNLAGKAAVWASGWESEIMQPENLCRIRARRSCSLVFRRPRR